MDCARWICSMVVDVEVSNYHCRVVEFLDDKGGVNVMGMRRGGSVAVVDIDDRKGWFA